MLGGCRGQCWGLTLDAACRERVSRRCTVLLSPTLLAPCPVSPCSSPPAPGSPGPWPLLQQHLWTGQPGTRPLTPTAWPEPATSVCLCPTFWDPMGLGICLQQVPCAPVTALLRLNCSKSLMISRSRWQLSGPLGTPCSTTPCFPPILSPEPLYPRVIVLVLRPQSSSTC